STVEGNITTGVPPFGSASQILVGVLHPGATSWEVKTVHTATDAGGLAGVIFPWIALDRAGNVYAMWNGRSDADAPINTYVSPSTDHGETWAAPYQVNQDVGNAHIYVTGSGGDDGVLDLAWYTSTTPSPDDTSNDWYVDFAQIRGAASASPQIS